jgi:PPOX class probable F420-dependent enzyme
MTDDDHGSSWCARFWWLTLFRPPRGRGQVVGRLVWTGDRLHTEGVDPALRDLVSTSPLCHLTTLNPDGSPQVTVVWVGVDGDELVTGHLPHNQKVRNMERDPRVALSFLAPPEPGAFLQPYAAVRATASVVPSDDAWDLLDRLAKGYVGPDATFPAPRRPGYVVRYAVEKVGGIGPWAG